jgi:uncharacterized iron-regulated membrane protein
MKRKNRKIKLLILALVAAGLVGWAFYAKYGQPKKAATQTSNSGTSSVQPSTDPNSGKQTAEAPAKTGTDTTSTPAATNQSTQASNLSIVISRAGQIGSALQIRAIIQGTTTGTCTAKLTNSAGGSFQTTHAAEIQQTGTTCGSFDIPTSSFSANGQWQLALTITSNGQTSAPATQSVTITK